MESSCALNNQYNVCVIDVGSPKEGNLGWYFKYSQGQGDKECSGGNNLDDLFEAIANSVKDRGLILGFEAPISVPLREKIEQATKARTADRGNRAWSAGPGAAVLATNLPIMAFVFRGIQAMYPKVRYYINENNFSAKPGEVMIFEAFVSGGDKSKDKDNSHIGDAKILTNRCWDYSKRKELPPSELTDEDGVTYFNLAAAALQRCGVEISSSDLSHPSPIYKPNK